MDLNSAIQAHADWKVKLRSAIQTKSKVDAAALAVDNKCPFGQWLHGEAKFKHGKLASYCGCVAEHAAFHREAGKVAAAINAGKFPEAEAMLGAGTPYAAASSAVGTAVVKLRKEAGI